MSFTLSLNYSETDIIQACVHQERWAQQILYEQTFGLLMGVCLRYAGSYDEAMDILHDGYIKIFRSVHQYEQNTSLISWMRRIMINTAIDHYRVNKRKRTEDIEQAWHLKNEDPGPMEMLKEKELLSNIQQLPPIYRTIFNLYIIEGFTHREIGEKLSISESTSRSNLVKARAKLRAFLNDNNE